MRPTITVIVELPQMQNLVDCAGIGLKVSDQLLVVTSLLECRKANLLQREAFCGFFTKRSSSYCDPISEVERLSGLLISFLLAALYISHRLVHLPVEGEQAPSGEGSEASLGIK
jgi:hypothetical protein